MAVNAVPQPALVATLVPPVLHVVVVFAVRVPTAEKPEEGVSARVGLALELLEVRLFRKVRLVQDLALVQALRADEVLQLDQSLAARGSGLVEPHPQRLFLVSRVGGPRVFPDSKVT